MPHSSIRLLDLLDEAESAQGQAMRVPIGERFVLVFRLSSTRTWRKRIR